MKSSLTRSSVSQNCALTMNDMIKELLELSSKFVGEDDPNFTQFRLPGATSHARFMLKAIYNYKMFLFRDQFTMTARELNGVRSICIF